MDKTKPHEPLSGRNSLCSHAHEYLKASIIKTLRGENRTVFIYKNSGIIKSLMLYLAVFPGRVEPPGARGASGRRASCGGAVTGHLTPGEVTRLTTIQHHVVTWGEADRRRVNLYSAV